MHFPLKNIVIIVLGLIGAFLVIDTLRFALLAMKSKTLIKEAVRFERVNPEAKMKILVLGDSTAFGTGSETPELSIAGRLGSLYPEASVTNLAVNGLKLDGLLKILDKIDLKEHFSIILVQIGANDIVQLTSMDDIEKETDLLLSKLSPHTDKLIILHSGNIGDAKMFPFYYRPILTKRSYEVRDIYKKLADTYGVSYIDLIDTPAGKLLNEDPAKYYAADSLHLSGAGYGLWFDEIRKAL